MASEEKPANANSLVGNSSSEVAAPDGQSPESSDLITQKPAKTHYPLSFWLAFLGLCCTGLVSALDGSIVATALPTIVAELHGGDNYVWVVNVYFLTR